MFVVNRKAEKAELRLEEILSENDLETNVGRKSLFFSYSYS